MKWFKCCHCGEWNPADDFYNNKSKPSGKKPRCKSCDLLSRDKVARAKYEKEYWDKRREKRREMILRSFNNNADHHKKKRREYLDSPRGKERHKQHCQNRRARVAAAFVEFVSHRDLYVEQMGRFHLCNTRRYYADMELDHVIPLARGGLHKKDNCKMACASCNRSKGAKLPQELSYQVV